MTFQKRVVYNVFMMFGDVGGLNDFLELILTAFFSLFSNQLLLGALVEKMFMASSNDKQTMKNQTNQEPNHERQLG